MVTFHAQMEINVLMALDVAAWIYSAKFSKFKRWQ